MHKLSAFCVLCLVLLAPSFSSNVLAYWPIVFQVAKAGADFASIQGPIHVTDGGIVADSKMNSTITAASYNLVLREFDSFRKDILQAMEVYLQMYPADARAHEFGKTGKVYFNGAIVKEFNLTTSFPREGLFFDESNYRFTKSVLDFPIPMYRHLSEQSLFIPVPSNLLQTNINVTFVMDSNVLWEIYVVSVIVRIIPEQVAPWWQENLSLLYGIVSAELISIVFITLKILKLYRKRISIC